MHPAHSNQVRINKHTASIFFPIQRGGAIGSAKDDGGNTRTGLAIAEPLNGIRGVRAITQALFFALIQQHEKNSTSTAP
jgi:hypothetical protein